MNMKYVLIMLMLLLVGCANAVDINDACSSRGYSNTLSSWTYNGTYKETFGDASVNVVGTARKLNWTSVNLVDAVVYKSGTRTYSSDGGYNGTIPKTTLSNDIVFVAFCGTNEVPEFSVAGAIVALLISLGIVIYKKK